MSRTPRNCTVDGCAKLRTHSLYCPMHYERVKVHGSVDGGGRRYLNPQDALRERVRREGDCMLWTGSLSPGGYGDIVIAGKSKKAHRFAWEQANGPIPDGFELDHSCWHPACVNLDHLRLVTRAENNRYVRGARSNNRSTGARNVRLRNGRYNVRVRKDGKAHHFGSFDTLAEAITVAASARLELFGEFAGKG